MQNKKHKNPELLVSMEHFELVIDIKPRILSNPNSIYIGLGELLALDGVVNNAWAQMISQCVSYDAAKTLTNKYSLRHSFIHYVAQFATPTPTARYVSELIGFDAGCAIIPNRKKDYPFFAMLKQLTINHYINHTAYVCKRIWRNGLAYIIPSNVQCSNDHELILFDCQKSQIDADGVDNVWVNGVQCGTMKHLIATHDDLKSLLFDKK